MIHKLASTGEMAHTVHYTIYCTSSKYSQPRNKSATVFHNNGISGQTIFETRIGPIMGEKLVIGICLYSIFEHCNNVYGHSVCNEVAHRVLTNLLLPCVYQCTIAISWGEWYNLRVLFQLSKWGLYSTSKFTAPLRNKQRSEQAMQKNIECFVSELGMRMLG